MGARLHVARADAHDAAAMAAIHQTCFAKAWDATAMAQFIASPDVLCLLGSVGGDRGTTAGGMLIARKVADEAELLTLAVAPSCRGSGLGRALLEQAIATLRDSGTRQLFLEVDEQNVAALNLYQSLGAKAVGHRPRYYEHGADAAIFSLALSPPAADDAAGG